MFSFKEFIQLWKTADSLTQALEDSHTMLGTTREMFAASARALRQSHSSEVDIDVYEMDQAINRYEQRVRRKVLKHLAIAGGGNVIPGLVLTSIVIDIERIGDYTKNIKDLAVAHPSKLECGRYESDIERVEKAFDPIYEKIIPALKGSDSKLASAIMADNWWILKKCDEIVGDLISSPDPDLSASDAITTALYVRYLKRIAAHLINVASGIVNPFERIGFREEE